MSGYCRVFLNFETNDSSHKMLIMSIKYKVVDQMQSREVLKKSSIHKVLKACACLSLVFNYIVVHRQFAFC